MIRFWRGDPMALAICAEKFNSGCRQCQRSIYDKSKSKYVCKLNIAGHPENDSNCFGFKEKKK